MKEPPCARYAGIWHFVDFVTALVRYAHLNHYSLKSTKIPNCHPYARYAASEFWHYHCTCYDICSRCSPLNLGIVLEYVTVYARYDHL